MSGTRRQPDRAKTPVSFGVVSRSIAEKYRPLVAVGGLGSSVYVQTVRLNAGGQAARMHDLELVRRLGTVRWPHVVAADPRGTAAANLPICQRSFNRQSTAFVMRGLSVRLRPLALWGTRDAKRGVRFARHVPIVACSVLMRGVGFDEHCC